METFTALDQPRSEQTLELRRLLGWTLTVCGSLLLALCALLLLRRATGSLHRPLSAGQLVAVTLVAVALLCGMRLIWRHVECGTRPPVASLLRLAGPSLGILLLGLAISLPGSSAWAVALFWFCVIVEEGAWWALGWKDAREELRWIRRAGSREVQSAQRPSSWPAVPELEEDAECLSPDVVQQFTRIQNESGEFLYGQLRCDFAPGQRTREVHLAFCPPLAAQPELQVNQVEGPEVSIKPAQLEVYGTRLELRLQRRDSRPHRVVVQFEAGCPAAPADPQDG